MNKQLISVIVPVYKVEQYLRRCVDSILAQTYTNIEVILIDDGSPDGCPAICDEYAEKDSRVVVIHQKNAGVSAARNAGLDVAKGEYIGFVDSDDWIEPDMYEVLLELATKNNVDISAVGFCINDDFCDNKSTAEVEIISQRDAIIAFLNGKIYPAIWHKLFEARIIKNIRFVNDFTIGEDLIFTLEAIDNSNGFACSSTQYYHYFQRQDSAIHSINKKCLSVFDSHEYLYKYIYAKYPLEIDEVNRKILNRSVELSIMLCFSNQFDDSYYKVIFKYAKAHLTPKAFSMLPFNYRVWLVLLLVNRNLFILGRRVYGLLSRSNK